MKNDVTNMNGG